MHRLNRNAFALVPISARSNNKKRLPRRLGYGLNCYRIVYSCFEKGCPTEKHQSVRDNTERHDGLWLFTVASSSSRVFSAMEGGAMNTCFACVKRNKIDSEHLLTFIEYFPDYLSALSRTLLPFFGQPLSKQLYYLD